MSLLPKYILKSIIVSTNSRLLPFFHDILWQVLLDKSWYQGFICLSVIGLGKSCRHAGLQFPHGSRWEEECNTCQCVNGHVRCSKVGDFVTRSRQAWARSRVSNRPFLGFSQVRCGRRPCLLPKAPPSPPDSNAVPSCPGGHECVEHPFLICFSPPCHQWGVCSTPDPPTPLQTQCEPNSGYLDNSCARITLIFKKDKVPQVQRNNITDISDFFRIFWHIIYSQDD